MSTRNKAAADAEVIHIPACRRLAQICWLLDFHMAVSSASPPPPQAHGASGSCLEQIPTCDRAWTNGISQTSGLQHRKQGLGLSYPPAVVKHRGL